MTTISTVGFGEIEALGTRGRLFTVGFVVGVGVAFYTLSGLVEELFEHQITPWGRWRMDRQIETLQGHSRSAGTAGSGARSYPWSVERVDEAELLDQPVPERPRQGDGEQQRKTESDAPPALHTFRLRRHAGAYWAKSSGRT